MKYIISLSKVSVYLSEIEKEFENEFEKDPIPYRRVTTELKGDMRDFRLV